MKANITPIWRGWVEGGKIKLYATKGFADYVSKLEKQLVDLVVRKHKEIRTLRQNAYWHAVPVEMVREAMGELDHEVTHFFLKEKFNYKIATFQGKEIKVILSTTKLSKSRFSELWKDVQIWAAQDLNLNIPDPNEVDIDFDWDEEETK